METMLFTQNTRKGGSKSGSPLAAFENRGVHFLDPPIPLRSSLNRPVHVETLWLTRSGVDCSLSQTQAILYYVHTGQSCLRFRFLGFGLAQAAPLVHGNYAVHKTPEGGDPKLDHPLQLLKTGGSNFLTPPPPAFFSQ